jgi:hypothetical protein
LCRCKAYDTFEILWAFTRTNHDQYR